MVDKILPMTGFKLQISGVGSHRSTNWATTTAQGTETSLNNHSLRRKQQKAIAFVENVTSFFFHLQFINGRVYSRGDGKLLKRVRVSFPEDDRRVWSFFCRNKAFQEMFILVCQLFLILRFCCQHGPEIRPEVKINFNLVLSFYWCISCYVGYCSCHLIIKINIDLGQFLDGRSLRLLIRVRILMLLRGKWRVSKCLSSGCVVLVSVTDSQTFF